MRTKWYLLAWLILLVDSPSGLARSKSKGCDHFVHYDKRTLSITGPSLPKVSIGKIDTSPKQIQEAAELTELFDEVQFSNCQSLVNLEQLSPEDAIAANLANLQSNQKLMELAVWFKAYSNQESGAQEKLAKSAASSLPIAEDIWKAPDAMDKLKTIASSFPDELSEELRKLQPAATSRDKLWALFPESTKNAIHNELVRAINSLNDIFRSSLDFATFLFMPAGNGLLYVPHGMVVVPRKPGLSDVDATIPLSYGVAGVAFEEDKIVKLVNMQEEPVQFYLTGPKALESQKEARRLLLPPRSMQRVDPKTRWILAVPVLHANDVIAVMTISVYGDLNAEQKEDLQTWGARGTGDEIEKRIASLLYLKGSSM